MREAYNLALARAGFGEIICDKRGKSTRYRARVKKIEGHVFGKYHLKVYKKRWFTMAVTAVPTYVAQAMLGRGAYLDEYYIQPLDKRQEFARKILKAVSMLVDKADKTEIANKTAEILGIDPSLLDEKKLAQLKDAFAVASQFAKLPIESIDKLKALIAGDKE